jgi:hypothetical protein
VPGSQAAVKPDSTLADPLEATMKRHLAFSLYPRRCPDHGWRRSVRELTTGARWEQFDTATVAVAEDDCCDSRDDVIEAFPSGTEFIFAPNTPLQETEQFVALLERVREHCADDDLIFRAHSKSCTHTAASASALWLSEMATVCLDYPQLVDCALERAHVAGAFRSIMPFGSSQFHFAGSFGWIRAGELFRREWRRIDRWFAGSESYFGTHFGLHESFCLFFDGAHTARLYDPSFHRENILPALSWWHQRLQYAGLTPICVDPPTVGRARARQPTRPLQASKFST